MGFAAGCSPALQGVRAARAAECHPCSSVVPFSSRPSSRDPDAYTRIPLQRSTQSSRTTRRPLKMHCRACGAPVCATPPRRRAEPFDRKPRVVGKRAPRIPAGRRNINHRTRDRVSMTVDMIVRRNASYQDPRLVPLRMAGIASPEKAWRIEHRFGYYHSGSHAGQPLVVVSYPDMETHQPAMQGMAQDADWQRIAAELAKIAPLQESYLTVITEEQ